jgi:hypothetical protein
MRQEIDSKVMAAIAVVLIVVVIAIYLFAFRGKSGELTPAEAGMGPPMQPGMSSDPALGTPPPISKGVGSGQ